MDLPRRGVAAVAVGGTVRVAVPAGVGPRGPLWRGRGGRADMVLGRGGGAVPGGRRGGGVEPLVDGAAIPCAGGLVQAVLWPVGVGWWAVVVVVVVMVVVLVVGAHAAVALVVVVVVVRVCPQHSLGFQWGFRVGNHLQLLGLYGSEGSGGGLGVRLDDDSGRGVPCPRVGLASGRGGLRGMDDGALGDRDVDEGFDRVVLCDCRCGGGSRWAEGRSGCAGCGVPACVWVRVWVRAGTPLLQSCLW